MSTENLIEEFVPNQVTVHSASIDEVIDDINLAITKLDGFDNFKAFEKISEDTVNSASNIYVWPSSQRAMGIKADNFLQYCKECNGKYVAIEIMQRYNEENRWVAKANTSLDAPAWAPPATVRLIE
ncbi:hypothetical protein FBU31_002748 [Coemansia sp. 'formosensis']|nr:hypothetical protein FBU31_002748 [Coemansia sp. 'formosensis']